MRPPIGRGGHGGHVGRGGGPVRANNGGGRGGRGDGNGGRGRGGRGGRGGGRGRGGASNGGGGMIGGSKQVITPHRHEGVFIFRTGKNNDALLTKNLVPGESLYNEKRIAVQGEDGTKVEYRVWNPYRSKLAAAILGGLDDIC